MIGLGLCSLFSMIRLVGGVVVQVLVLRAGGLY